MQMNRLHFFKTLMSSLDVKIVVLGAKNVGKTSVINRYCNGTFSDKTKSTIGAGFYTHTCHVGSTTVSMMLWDTAGEERFRSVTPSLLRGTSGLILVFDLQDAETLTELNVYFEMYLNTVEGEDDDYPVIVLGNKCDLGPGAVTDEVVHAWMERNNLKMFERVSALSGDNVDAAFQRFLEDLVKKMETVRLNPVSIAVEPTAPHAEKKKCC